MQDDTEYPTPLTTRPCCIDNGVVSEDAIFHKWADDGRKAIVEFRDGCVNVVYVDQIRFLDGGDFSKYDSYYSIAKE